MSSQLVVFITGCSDGGIGSCLAESFAQKNCLVYATSRSFEKMALLKEKAKQLKLSIEFLELDVTSLESIEKCFDSTQNLKNIDVLINNAGLNISLPLLDTSAEEVRSLFETNFLGVLSISNKVIPHMIKRNKGVIVNVGSIVGDAPTPYSGIYSSLKTALHSMSEVLRKEVRPFGIDVLVIKPGAIKSNIGKNNLFTNKTLNKKSLYYKVEEYVKRRINISQQSKSSMDTDVFSKKVSDFVLAHYHRKLSAYSLYKVLLFGFFSLIANLLLGIGLKSPVLNYFDNNSVLLKNSICLGGYSWMPIAKKLLPDFIMDTFLWVKFGLGNLSSNTLD